ncbi:hypothetical protein FPOA_13952 [Fusarium poae]|uniref:Uncharacterized protein n=1 Tax=Fusarium poae TaxID=36050 RepID=A0A1B8A3V7_FUSPO|nr:hypothetical protein FPOA_13952 [Fusarium poae]
MRGLLYAEGYLPQKRFRNDRIDDDERYFELEYMAEERRHRILSLGLSIATSGRWLIWMRQLANSQRSQILNRSHRQNAKEYDLGQWSVSASRCLMWWSDSQTLQIILADQGHCGPANKGKGCDRCSIKERGTRAYPRGRKAK